LLGAPGKFVSAQAKLPVKVWYANTPARPIAAWCVPLMVQVAPGWAHLVQPDGASAACARPVKPVARKTAIPIFKTALRIESLPVIFLERVVQARKHRDARSRRARAETMPLATPCHGAMQQK